MVNLKKGDKVMITDADAIVFGDKYFKHGEVVTVMSVEHDGIDVSAPNHSEFATPYYINGVPTLFIGNGELKHIAKLLPVNAEETEEDAT